jgi:hypothetical protein
VTYQQDKLLARFMYNNWPAVTESQRESESNSSDCIVPHKMELRSIQKRVLTATVRYLCSTLRCHDLGNGYQNFLPSGSIATIFLGSDH